MASWMVHLRIADKLLEQIPGLSPIEFIVGNIAPDSGVPNEDWSAFSPPYAVSHFKTGTQKAGPEAFAAKYFTPDQRAKYTPRAYGFYLGYLTHLLTDRLWSEKIALPSFRKHIGGEPPFRGPQVDTIKEDWYDLDFKYLRDHPGFRAFRVYLGAVGFRNEFLEEFSPDAIDNRRQYITSFYLQGKENLDREYPYLAEAEMDAFVEEAAKAILDTLHTNYGIVL
nr:zinc dependent phospholipase C family protein [Oscillospiraceae bacterium]